MRALLSLLSAIVPSSLIRPVAHSLDVRSTGCGTSRDFAGQTKSFTINSSGGQRDYLLYLPTNYDAAKEQPLLIAYHGAGGSPEQIQYQTGYSGGDVNKDMIVAYPRGIKVILPPVARFWDFNVMLTAHRQAGRGHRTPSQASATRSSPQT